MQGIKRNWGFIAVVFLAFVLGMMVNGQRAESQNGQVGRYQLCSAEYEGGTDSGEVFKFDAVFKIDTTTGTTWMYANLPVDGKRVRKWVPAVDS